MFLIVSNCLLAQAQLKITVFCLLVAEKVVNSKHEIKGKVVQIELEKVETSEERCRTVFVSGLPEEVTENNVHIYFQKKKNGGGEVKKVEMLGQGKARVIFEEHEGSSDYDFWKYIR